MQLLMHTPNSFCETDLSYEPPADEDSDVSETIIVEEGSHLTGPLYP